MTDSREIPEIYIQVQPSEWEHVPDGHDYFKMKCGPGLPKTCDRCLKQKGVLKVRPTCGSSVDSPDGDGGCPCGAVIWTCRDTNGKAYVTEFSRPSPVITMLKTEEDVI